MKMELLSVLALFIIVFGGFVLVLVLRPSAEANFQKWKDENNFEVLDRQTVPFAATPFSGLSTSKDETFYRVRIKTVSGEIKTGWVKCSGKFTALLSPPSEVIWDDK